MTLGRSYSISSVKAERNGGAASAGVSVSVNVRLKLTAAGTCRQHSAHLQPQMTRYGAAGGSERQPPRTWQGYDVKAVDSQLTERTMQTIISLVLKAYHKPVQSYFIRHFHSHSKLEVAGVDVGHAAIVGGYGVVAHAPDISPPTIRSRSVRAGREANKQRGLHGLIGNTVQTAN